VDDVAKFFKTHYAPNNAVRVLSGDIKIPEAKKLIEQYFADIPSQPQPKHPDLTEPPPTEPRHEVHKDPLARVPGVVVGNPGPPRRSPDFYAMVMLDVILTGGESSRLQQNLVKGKQSVIQYEANLGWPFASPTDYRDPGPYAFFLLYKPNFDGKQIVAQLEEEIANIQKSGVDPKELERARTFLRSYRINLLQTSLSRARVLGQYEILDGKPELINTELDQFLAVTAPQIQAAAKKYVVPSKRTVLDIVPAPKEQPSEKPASN
jgi:predicted Zn-dependent peptidase